MLVAPAEKSNQKGRKIRKLIVPVFFIFWTGCAFNAEDWEPKGEKLSIALKHCQTEILQRDPLLGPLWYWSKDFAPCMEGFGHFKR
ncbi:MAG: hypothetical protein NPINA01_20920 [Nitrospinaceae bacterium]|nr:MAG: hypothetical protein NPINA01_20920 [Nitrospinaceae bacterium]